VTYAVVQCVCVCVRCCDVEIEESLCENHSVCVCVYSFIVGGEEQCECV